VESVAQTFENESFDLIITSDVFEHCRTSRQQSAKSCEPLIRAMVKADVLQYLEKPDDHGNSTGSSGSSLFTKRESEVLFLLPRPEQILHDYSYCSRPFTWN
jgi:hypothetical protein